MNQIALPEIKSTLRQWKRYPKLKDSGIPWLGETPEGWEVNRLRFHIKSNPSKAEINHLPKDTDVSFIPMEAVGKCGGVKADETKPLDEVSNGYTYFRNNDVVVAKITPCFENGKGAIVENLINTIGFGTTELHVLRPDDNFCVKYLFYLTISYPFRKIGESWMYGAGGQKRVAEDFIRNLRHPIPPLEEQQTISDFLDQETGKIDQLIEKKERQIELLKEKRTAFISHVVTKGLDPNAKLKDSGIPWLGKIPEKWDCMRFKFLISVPLQYGANESAEHDEPSWPRYVRITDISENGLLREDTFKSLPQEIAEPYLLNHGDLLFARSGATVGKTFLYKSSWGKSAYAGYLIRASMNLKRIDPIYISYFCNSSNYWDWLKSTFIQATIQNVSAEKYANLFIPLFPLEEQQTIADFLDRETGKIDQLIEKVQESIDKLREFRTSLISAAVTGKIDVREEVA